VSSSICRIAGVVGGGVVFVLLDISEVVFVAVIVAIIVAVVVVADGGSVEGVVVSRSKRGDESDEKDLTLEWWWWCKMRVKWNFKPTFLRTRSKTSQSLTGRKRFCVTPLLCSDCSCLLLEVEVK